MYKANIIMRETDRPRRLKILVIADLNIINNKLEIMERHRA